jgi:hypothetical protein
VDAVAAKNEWARERMLRRSGSRYDDLEAGVAGVDAALHETWVVSVDNDYAVATADEWRQQSSHNERKNDIVSHEIPPLESLWGVC